MGAHLSQPFQHQAIDSCHTIPCTKCHLSYYKFSAEYSADPMGLRTKREHWQGHLWNARRELPPSLGCEAASWPLRLWVWQRQLRLPAVPQPRHDCWCVHQHLYNISSITHSSWISGLSSWRKWFVSVNGINTLVTFRQPWHNCVINVTDSFADSSWLVLNHNTACTEDIARIQFNGMFLLLFDCMMM